MSLEAYLSLTDEDIQYLISTGLGDAPNNPFHGTAMKQPKKKSVEYEPHDDSLDYQLESEEIEIEHSIDLDSLPDQDTLD